MESQRLKIQSALFCIQKILDPKMGMKYDVYHMRIISKKILREFWAVHSDAEQPLKAWHAKVKAAGWITPSDIKSDYRNAGFVANNRVVFNIKGNKYRLIATVNYDFGVVYIRFVGPHQAYNKIDATTV